jgi:hypothetical protein
VAGANDWGDMKERGLLGIRCGCKYVVAGYLIAIMLLSGCAVLQEPRGAAAMARFDRLPCFKTGTTIHQVSTFDRGGGNADGSHFYLYQQADGFVVLDEVGPGTVYRIWATGNSGVVGRMRMYFDGEQKVDIPLEDFFSGSTDPFLFPLVGNDEVSSGGFYSYYPFSFEQSLRIEFTVVPQYYQITYHLYDTAEGVTTYTGQEDLSAVYGAWNNPSVDPKPAAKVVSVGPFNLLPGHSKELLDVRGPGSIQSLSLPEMSRNIRIQMYWDGQLGVDIPASYLFGFSLLAGADPPMFYNYFPMPYRQRATIVLTNESDTAIEARAVFGIGDMVCDSYFMAAHHQGRSVEGRDFSLLDIDQWRGHIVGTILDISRFDDLSVLEGDEHIVIDGHDVIQGTGTEDFFNGGWYYNRGAFALPVHGATQVRGHIVAYRLTLADAIPFEQSISFGMEHGGANDVNGDFESVVFFYATKTQT